MVPESQPLSAVSEYLGISMTSGQSPGSPENRGAKGVNREFDPREQGVFRPSRESSLTVLLTGFGPFPGAPFNPTQALVGRLGARRRPALAADEVAEALGV